MIAALSLAFEGIAALLMVALIVYCVRLNRSLTALRANDTGIRDMIAELRAAAERAEHSTARLKDAGLDAERSLRIAIEEGEAVVRELKRLAGPASAGAASTRRTAYDRLAPSRRPQSKPAAPTELAADPPSRSDAERELLKAIRVARTGG